MKTQIASGPLGTVFVDPALVPQRSLYTGAKMPAIGLGTFGSDHVSSTEVAAAVLALYSVSNVVLVAVTMGGGKAGLYAMFATFFFMSIGFPTIFALGIRGLGEHTKLGSSLIVMSIVGGAIAPPFMGHIADRHSMRFAFVVPLVCFVFIAVYGLIWSRLNTLDSLARAGE